MGLSASKLLPPQEVNAVVISDEKSVAEPPVELKGPVPSDLVIWTQIATHLTDPQDLENLSKTCKYFEWILQPRRVEYLFPKVWKILAKKFERDLDEAYGPIRAVFGGHEPDHSKRFKRTVQLRAVCKSWCKTLDDQFERDSFYYLDPGNYYKWDHGEESFYYGTLGQITDFYEGNYEGNNVEIRAQEFVTKFRNSHYGSWVNLNFKNPFLGRFFRVQYIGARWNTRNFWKTITTCLTLFGNHVWFCELNSNEYEAPGRNQYAKTCDLLQLMPNTKILKISYTEDWDWDTDDQTVMNGQELEQRLQMEVLNRPMPRLENLKGLSVNELPAVMFNSLALQNPQIEVLHVDTIKKTINDYDYSLLPNLTSFSLSVFHESNLTKLENATWPGLKKLNLDFFLNVSHVSWTNAIPIIERKWAATLTDFRLALSSGDPRQALTAMIECSLFRMKLPNLERLEFAMGHFATIDFILPMTESLQELDITVGCDIARIMNTTVAAKIIADQQVIQFVGYFDRMLDSNIWEMFTKLQVLHLKEEYYENRIKTENEWTLLREDWKRLMRKKNTASPAVRNEGNRI